MRGMNKQDIEYMRLALQLAEKGRGFVNPNPMVGAVIVKNGVIIGQGYHEKYGELHAERNAIKNCKESPEGATIYVTLEPCCHYGKTPPCTEAIIEKKIKRVVIGSKDPNPLVSGKGVQILREHGIEVCEGVLEKACDELNSIFFHYIKTNTPYVVMKYAMTMDGKIATVSGLSQWITGEEARKRVHQDRSNLMGIMVGMGTVLADDPMLTSRIEGGKNPIRIVCDTRLRTPLSSKLVQTANEVRTIIATCEKDKTKHQAYEEKGCEVLVVSSREEHLDMSELMTALGKMKIDSILLEGGGTLNWSCLQQGIVQRVQTYIAPKIFGGVTAKTPIAGTGVNHPSECFTLIQKRIEQIGDDILIESEVKQCSQES